MENNNIEFWKRKIFRGVGLQILLSFAVSLTAFSDGLLDGWIAEKIAELTASGYSLSKVSLLGTLAYYANIAVLPFAVFSANKFGRKWTMSWGAFFIFISWTMLYLLEYIYFIYVAIFCEGLGMFIAYTIIEIYISEISDPKIRGFLCSCVPVLVNLGILSSYIYTTYTSLKNLSLFGIIIITLTIPFHCTAPESPFFLVMKNKPLAAKDVLMKLRDSSQVEEELNDIKAVIASNNQEKGSIVDFFTDKTNRKILIIVLGVQIIQQFSGIDTILIFIEVIFDASDGILSSNLSMIILGVFKCISCIFSLVLLDKIGRRPLLIFSCAVSTISLFLLGLYFFCQEILQMDVTQLSWTPLLILIMYIIGYNIGLGTVVYILGSEMFPTKFNALGVSITQVVYVVFVIIVTEVSAKLKDQFGFYLVFWSLSYLTFFGLLFVIFYVPETKGKSLRKILNEVNSTY